MSDNNKKRINVTTTQYEGDAFPEAPHYCEYVAECLAASYPDHEVSVSFGSKQSVFVYGSDIDPDDVSDSLVDCWENFCTFGYEAYTCA